MEDTDDGVTEVVQFQAERGKGGRFLTKPKGLEKFAITSENAADMARRRWQKYREAAADAVTEEMGSIVPGITTPEQAWGVLNARLANAYERTEMENQPSGADMASAAMQLAAILRDALSGREIIDSPAIDVPALTNDDNDTRNE
jgi:hypothetical protein